MKFDANLLSATVCVRRVLNTCSNCVTFECLDNRLQCALSANSFAKMFCCTLYTSTSLFLNVFANGHANSIGPRKRDDSAHTRMASRPYAYECVPAATMDVRTPCRRFRICMEVCECEYASKRLKRRKKMEICG